MIRSPSLYAHASFFLNLISHLNEVVEKKNAVQRNAEVGVALISFEVTGAHAFIFNAFSDTILNGSKLDNGRLLK